MSEGVQIGLTIGGFALIFCGYVSALIYPGSVPLWGVSAVCIGGIAMGIAGLAGGD